MKIELNIEENNKELRKETNLKKYLSNYEKEIYEKDLNFNEIWEQGKVSQISKNGELIGIYVISNIKSNFHYIGSSHDIMGRLKKHLSSMKNNNHSNKKILEDVNKYGIDSFTFKVLEYCSNSQLSRNELKWLKEYNSKEVELYNLKELSNWNSGINKMNRKELGR